MVIDKDCGICLHFMLMSLTRQSADIVFSPFLFANSLLKKNDVSTHCMSSCSYLCWIQEFLSIKISVGSYGHSSNNNLPWARSTLAASSVQMHSSCKKRNNVVFLLMSTMREAGKLSSGFFKLFFYYQRKYQAKAVKGKNTVLAAMA